MKSAMIGNVDCSNLRAFMMGFSKLTRIAIVRNFKHSETQVSLRRSIFKSEMIDFSIECYSTRNNLIFCMNEGSCRTPYCNECHFAIAISLFLTIHCGFHFHSVKKRECKERFVKDAKSGDW